MENIYLMVERSDALSRLCWITVDELRMAKDLKDGHEAYQLTGLKKISSVELTVIEQESDDGRKV